MRLRRLPADAVTVIRQGEDGLEAEIFFRQGGDPSRALAEEASHLEQIADERLADKVGRLSEENLARWPEMEVSEQLDLYQVMLELEIDAQRRILAKYGDDPQVVAQAQDTITELDLRLQQVDEALQDPSVRPDWLDPDRPPRLFNHGGYDPKLRTDAELQLDRDPTPRSGETPEQAQRRADAADVEIQVRLTEQIYDQLGETPPRLNVRVNDTQYAGNGAHTIERHGPDVPLRQADAPGQRTIEGRIYGDPPWANAENYSYRWIDESMMNRTLNEYVQANWDDIRTDLAFEEVHKKTFDAGGLVGEGFFNINQGGFGPKKAVYGQTSSVSITIRLVPGNPPSFYIVTAFPAGRGF